MIQTEKVNLEQSNVTGKNYDGKSANTPVRVLTASSITGDDVENQQGDKIAVIKDIMLNLQNGTIEYVILSAGGFLGLGDKLFALPYQELHLKADKKVFVIDRDKEYIKNAPGFDQNHWPETNSHYDQINDYWGSSTNPYASLDTVTDYNAATRLGTSGIVDPGEPTTSRGPL